MLCEPQKGNDAELAAPFYQPIFPLFLNPSRPLTCLTCHIVFVMSSFYWIRTISRYTELPSHSCFETSSRPGCEDQVCLEQVCLLNDFCCSDSYNQTCVQTARRNGLSCAPPPVTNSCLDPSPFGGCTNEVCQQIVCTERPTCCSDGNLVGEWSTECADLARRACTVYVSYNCLYYVRICLCSRCLEDSPVGKLSDLTGLFLPLIDVLLSGCLGNAGPG